MQKMAHFTAPLLPANKPRYLMGVGRPEDLVEGVRAGIDMFDCVMPTRNARNGQLFTSQGKLNIKNAALRRRCRSARSGLRCETCTKYSRAYLRHLYICREVLSARLNTLHNLSYYLASCADARRAILENRFDAWASDYSRFRSRKAPKACVRDAFTIPRNCFRSGWSTVSCFRR